VHPVELVPAFGALGDDTLGVVTDANGHLALVVNRGSAAKLLGVQVGDVVVLRPRVPSASSRP
jgi:S-adenosylmethionine hydrolase